jgi:molecular chaperone HscB
VIPIVEGKCWNCQAKIGTGETFCKSCSKIQPFPKGIDYFQCLGLRRLLQLDLKELEQLFYKLSRRFHPDFHHGKDEREKNISLENSALLNKAYRTLKDPFSRVEYLIHLEDGNEGEIAAKIPQEFLEKIFALQETLEEFRTERSPDSRQKLEVQLHDAVKMLSERLADLEKRLFDIFLRWDQSEPSTDSHNRKLLVQQMKEILSYRTYFKNMIQDIEHLLHGHTERRVVRH